MSITLLLKERFTFEVRNCKEKSCFSAKKTAKVRKLQLRITIHDFMKKIQDLKCLNEVRGLKRKYMTLRIHIQKASTFLLLRNRLKNLKYLTFLEVKMKFPKLQKINLVKRISLNLEKSSCLINSTLRTKSSQSIEYFHP